MSEPNQAYYIISVGQGAFLDTHGRSACLWNNNGKDVDEIIAENISHTSPAAGHIRWRLLICPHQPNTVYIVNDLHKAFLDTHGTDLSIWNNRGQDISQIIAGNTSKYAGNIRWRILDCPHQPGTAYIVNVRHGKFLDADCGDLSLWNNGRDVDTVIAENTSRFAANIRWQILRVPLGTEGISHAPATVPQPRLVRIVHLSDTHSMHWSIEPRFPLPEGDILVHTGDFSNRGSDAEIADFDRWLGEVGPRYRHVVVIPGNHDWWGTLQRIEAGHLDPQRAVDPNFMQQKFRNCRVLCQEEVTLEGVRLFGCSWCPWQKDGGPDKLGNSSAYRATAEAWEASGGRRDVFCQVPQGLDVLLTHGPAHGILDCLGGAKAMAEESEEEAALELMPVLKATGERVLAGVTRHALLERCSLGVSTHERTLAGDVARRAAEACRELRAAKAMASKGEKYSQGQTYWVGLEDKPRDILERLAQEIFLQHTADVNLEDESVQKGLCGSEYWAVVCRRGDDVAPHFDKCYFLEDSHHINLHPLIGTVTYLTGVGAPTVVTGVSEAYLPCFTPTQESQRRRASLERKVPFAVSYPEEGKHLTFDGQLLHYADAELAVPSPGDVSERVALLVNVWVNYRPKDAVRRKLSQTLDPEPKQLMNFENRGALRDAGALEPRRRRTVRGGGGLWFSGLFAEGQAGATFWYGSEHCLGPEGGGEEASGPKKKKRRRQRAVEREVLALVEAGLGVEAAGRFLTTAFEGRDERRPDMLA